jgi:hypothetical protein
VTRTAGFRRDAAKLHMAKPYFILHAPQVRFIEKSSLTAVGLRKDLAC